MLEIFDTLLKGFLINSQAVNLLLNISPDCYEHLIPPESEKDNYLGHDVTSLINLAKFLESRLEQVYVT